MKLTIENDGTQLLLQAETPAELDFLEKMEGMQERGRWADAEFRLVRSNELGFAHENAGKRYCVSGMPERVMAAVRLNVDWLSYMKPKTIEEQLRANAAARIGHSLLDGFELVGSHK